MKGELFMKFKKFMTKLGTSMVSVGDEKLVFAAGINSLVGLTLLIVDTAIVWRRNK